MLRTHLLKWAAFSVAAIAAAGTAGASELSTVTLDAKAVSAGGIRTVELQQVERAQTINAFGIVLDPGPLINLAAQITAARGKLAAAHAAAALARSEAARATNLYGNQHNISQAAFQAAQAHLQVAQAEQASAQAQLGELMARARTDWGARLGAAAASGAAPLPQLESGTQQLVEASVPLGQSLPRVSTHAQASTPDGQPVALRWISRAPRAAAGVAGPGLYYLMTPQDSAPIGTPITVTLRGPGTVSGVLIPASAVVWHDGHALVYRQSSTNTFTPIALHEPVRVGQGYFVSGRDGAALQPGQHIVVAGAALVFSASQAPAPAAAAKAAKPDDDDD